MNGSVIAIPNPTNSQEMFCEAWSANPGAHNAFVEFVYDFRRKFQDLVYRTGFDNIAQGLDELFGETITKKAVASYTKRLTQARENKQVHYSSSPPSRRAHRRGFDVEARPEEQFLWAVSRTTFRRSAFTNSSRG